MMSKILLAGLLSVSVAILSSGCSSVDDPSPDGGAVADAGMIGNGCIQPFELGNNLKVGMYCTPGGQQCDRNDLSKGEAFLCTVDTEAEASLPMCTKNCKVNSECGEGAICTNGDATKKCSTRKGCVPKRCADEGDEGLEDWSVCQTDGGL
jgi:hypothetical protein